MGPVQHVNAQIVVPVYFVRTNRSLVGQVDVNNAVRGRNANKLLCSLPTPKKSCLDKQSMGGGMSTTIQQS